LKLEVLLDIRDLLIKEKKEEEPKEKSYEGSLNEA